MFIEKIIKVLLDDKCDVTIINDELLIDSENIEPLRKCLEQFVWGSFDCRMVKFEQGFRLKVRENE